MFYRHLVFKDLSQKTHQLLPRLRDLDRYKLVLYS